MSVHKLSHDWSGSTAPEHYPRDASASAPGKADIPMSAGAGFGGNDFRWNPEDTLGAALAQCHTLTFLALAHKVGLEITHVHTDVEVILEKGERTPEVTRCVLTSQVRVAPGHDPDKALEMYGKAHKYCFIANSLKGEVVTRAEAMVDEA